MLAKSFLLLFLLAGVCIAGDNNKYSDTKHYNWDLPANANLEIDANAADVNVVQGQKGKLDVTVRVHSDHEMYVKSLKTSFEMQGSTGMLSVKSPGSNGDAIVTVKLPVGTGVAVRSTAGDIFVQITGDKDITTTAGDVKVMVGTSKQYADVDISTNAGDIFGAAVCGEPKEQAGSSLQCSGQGKDHIRVRTTAGDVELLETDKGTGSAEI